MKSELLKCGDLELVEKPFRSRELLSAEESMNQKLKLFMKTIH